MGITLSVINDHEIVIAVPCGTSAYTAGYIIGTGAVKLPSVAPNYGGQARIRKVVVTDAAKQAPALSLVFFNKKPAVQTDNTAFAPTDAEVLASCVGKIEIATTDWKTFSLNSVAEKDVDDIPFRTVGARDLWVAFVSQGTPTFVSVADLNARLTFATSY